MNQCLIDTLENKSKNMITEKDLFKDYEVLIARLKAGDILLIYNDKKYCAELKIDQDWINSYNSKDWIEKIGNLIKVSYEQDFIPVVLVTLSDEFLTTRLTKYPKWNQSHDLVLWTKKFYDIRDQIQIKFPQVIFKLCLDSFPKDGHYSALLVGLLWLKDLVEGKDITKKPIEFKTPILVRDYTKNPVLALASLCDGVTVQMALDILVEVGTWEKLCQKSQDELLEVCKKIKVSKYNFVAESIYKAIRLQIQKERGDQ